MKTTLAALALAALALAAPAIAAEEVDVATLKCEHLISLKPDEGVMVLTWIDGYLGGAAEDTTFNVDRFGANLDGLMEACSKNPGSLVLETIKETEAARQ